MASRSEGAFTVVLLGLLVVEVAGLISGGFLTSGLTSTFGASGATASVLAASALASSTFGTTSEHAEMRAFSDGPKG